MELGVFPICIAGDIVELIVEPKLPYKDRNTIDNILIKGANKCVYLNSRTIISYLNITGRLIWSSKYKYWCLTWCVFIFFFIVFEVLVTAVLASLLVTNGIYGEPAELGVGVCILIIIQVHKIITTRKYTSL